MILFRVAVEGAKGKKRIIVATEVCYFSMEKSKSFVQYGNNGMKAKYFRILDWEGTLEITFSR